MTGKELADELFGKFNAGVAADDAALVEEMAASIAGLSPDEMWRFVYSAGAMDRHKSCDTFRAFNGAIAKDERFGKAIRAMHAVPRPADLPQPT